jgi:hypothetical protein
MRSGGRRREIREVELSLARRDGFGASRFWGRAIRTTAFVMYVMERLGRSGCWGDWRGEFDVGGCGYSFGCGCWVAVFGWDEMGFLYSGEA